MNGRLLVYFCVVLLTGTSVAFGQSRTPGSARFYIINSAGQAISGAHLILYRLPDSSLVLSSRSDSAGYVQMPAVPANAYYCEVSCFSFKTRLISSLQFKDGEEMRLNVQLDSAITSLSGVTVTALRNSTEFKDDRVVLNLESSIANTGLSAMEAIQNIPGISIDQNGKISFRGKDPVLVTIDGRNTYLTGANLVNLLSSISSSELSAIEVLYEAPASMDASGSGGVVNLRTRKLNRDGLNGTINSSYVQGRYPKNYNNALLNYKKGRLNLYAGGNYNLVRNFLELYALRTYDAGGPFKQSSLDQPSNSRARGYSYEARFGLEYKLSEAFTVNSEFSSGGTDRTSNGDNRATWINVNGSVDSVVYTSTNHNYDSENWNGTVGFTAKPGKGQTLTASGHLFRYSYDNDQNFRTFYPDPSRDPQTTLGLLSTQLDIYTGRVDYVREINPTTALNTGIKMVYSKTRNQSDYYLQNMSGIQPITDWLNRFEYNEHINAAYLSAHHDGNRLNLDAGLRYEYTGYDAHELIKDNRLSRKYNSLFPSFTAAWQVDTNHSFTLYGGRRIDRPAFEKINPFILIINKYTTQTGNPYIQPQFSWNAGVTHRFRNLLTTTLEYTHINNVFSQIFTTDVNGGVIYSEGNLDFKHSLSLNVALQLKPRPWWSLSISTTLLAQQIEGYIGRELEANIRQYNISANNQFKLGSWIGELSGYYNSRRREDIQEILYPMGNVSLGFARPFLDNKLRLKLAARDIFYTQPLEGLSTFQNSTEYFRMAGDSRQFVMTLSYNFGHAEKRKMPVESDNEEVQRAKSGD